MPWKRKTDTTVPVVSTEQRHEPTTVYNLRIVGTENFFVGKGRLLVPQRRTLCPNSVGSQGPYAWVGSRTLERGAVADSIRYHFGEHGEEVGAENVWQYLRKADNFGSLKGRGIPIEGRTDGVLHYFKGDRYIDVAPGGGIISYGARITLPRILCGSQDRTSDSWWLTGMSIWSAVARCRGWLGSSGSFTSTRGSLRVSDSLVSLFLDCFKTTRETVRLLWLHRV